MNTDVHKQLYLLISFQAFLLYTKNYFFLKWFLKCVRLEVVYNIDPPTIFNSFGEFSDKSVVKNKYFVLILWLYTEIINTHYCLLLILTVIFLNFNHWLSNAKHTIIVEDIDKSFISKADLRDFVLSCKP